MKDQTVYMCKNGHLHYGKECPQECKYCGSREFGLITFELLTDENMENINELPTTPGDGSN